MNFHPLRPFAILSCLLLLRGSIFADVLPPPVLVPKYFRLVNMEEFPGFEFFIYENLRFGRKTVKSTILTICPGDLYGTRDRQSLNAFPWGCDEAVSSTRSLGGYKEFESDYQRGSRRFDNEPRGKDEVGRKLHPEEHVVKREKYEKKEADYIVQDVILTRVDPCGIEFKYGKQFYKFSDGHEVPYDGSLLMTGYRWGDFDLAQLIVPAVSLLLLILFFIWRRRPQSLPV